MATEEKITTSTAVTLGFIGGVFGIVTGFLAMFFGGFGMLIEPVGGAQVVGMGFFAVACGLIGVVGGVVMTSRPNLAVVLLAVGGVGGFFAVTLFWILPGLLMIVAAVMGYRVNRVEVPA